MCLSYGVLRVMEILIIGMLILDGLVVFVRVRKLFDLCGFELRSFQCVIL